MVVLPCVTHLLFSLSKSQGASLDDEPLFQELRKARSHARNCLPFPGKVIEISDSEDEDDVIGAPVSGNGGGNDDDDDEWDGNVELVKRAEE